MTSNSPDGPARRDSTGLLSSVADHRQIAAYVLFGLGAAAFVALIALLWTYKFDGAREWILWLGALGAVAFGAGVYSLVGTPPAGMTQAENFRFLLLLVGGVAGFL